MKTLTTNNLVEILSKKLSLEMFSFETEEELAQEICSYLNEVDSITFMKDESDLENTLKNISAGKLENVSRILATKISYAV